MSDSPGEGGGDGRVREVVQQGRGATQEGRAETQNQVEQMKKRKRNKMEMEGKEGLLGT